jgi:hypothetical protein
MVVISSLAVTSVLKAMRCLRDRTSEVAIVGNGKTLGRTFVLGLLTLAPAQASAQPSDRPFNQLTSLVVSEDRRSIQLFGIYNPRGPREAIPYRELFADAFLLPDEKEQPDLGFSLEPASNFSAEWSTVEKRMNRKSSQALLLEDSDARREFLDSLLNQAIKEERGAVSRFLASRGFDEHQRSGILSEINTADDLKAVGRRMQEEGIISYDGWLHMLDDAAIRFQTTKGNVFLLPPGLAARMAGVWIRTEPRFNGIDPNTQLARIVLEGDVALKRVTTTGNGLGSVLPFHQSRIERDLRSGHYDNRIIAVNIRPTLIKLSLSSDKRVISFEDAKCAIRFAPGIVSQAPTPGEVAYSDFLTLHFDDYAEQIEPLWMVRELYKILAAVRYLKSDGVVISAPIDKSYEPPAQAETVMEAASVGTGVATNFEVEITGGIYLNVGAASSTVTMPAQRAEVFRAAAASTQLDSVFQSNGSGVCYDGQPGCVPGAPLGAIKLGANPRGSGNVSEAVLKAMQKKPELAKLLLDEQHAKAAWLETQDAIRQAQVELATAQSPSDKGRLQVALSNKIQKASTAQSLYEYTETKVEEGAKLIVRHQ